jgi:hypothetical protein
MDDWDFEIENEFEKRSESSDRNSWFDQFHEDHERSPKIIQPKNPFESIIERLTNAINRRASFTVPAINFIPENYKKKIETKISKKPKLTVPKSPKLRTKKRFGLTTREKEGISLNSSRKLRNLTRRTSFIF